MVGGTGMGSDYQYGLYPKGIERAKNILDRDTYLGPAPVSFDEYIRITKQVLDENKKAFLSTRRLWKKSLLIIWATKTFYFK